MKEATIDPAEVPATFSNRYPLASVTSTAPTKAMPLTPPPSNTPSTFLGSADMVCPPRVCTPTRRAPPPSGRVLTVWRSSAFVRSVLPRSDLPDRKAVEEVGSAHLANPEAVIAGAQGGGVGLIDRAAKGQGPEVERVNQAAYLGRPGIALQMHVTDIVASRRGSEEAVDPAGLGLRRIPEGEAVRSKPHPALGQIALHIREPVEVVAVPDVKKQGGSGLLADGKGRGRQPQVPLHQARHLRNDLFGALCSP